MTNLNVAQARPESNAKEILDDAVYEIWTNYFSYEVTTVAEYDTKTAIVALESIAKLRGEDAISDIYEYIRLEVTNATAWSREYTYGDHPDVGGGVKARDLESIEVFLCGADVENLTDIMPQSLIDFMIEAQTESADCYE